MKDSQKTQALFDRAVKEIDKIFEEGEVLDKALTEVILKTFLGHIKVRNLEVREAALKFVISRSLSENIEQLKQILPKTLPEYSVDLPQRGKKK